MSMKSLKKRLINKIMWIVLKYKKKEFSFLKQDFRKILGDLPLIFRPKFKYQKLIKLIISL